MGQRDRVQGDCPIADAWAIGLERRTLQAVGLILTHILEDAVTLDDIEREVERFRDQLLRAGRE